MHQIVLLRKYQIRSHKASGQHFLIDENIQAKIISTLGLERGDYVLEIGAGLGALTHGLLKTDAKVYAVEKDESLVQILQKELGHYSNLQLLKEDILRLDLGKILDKNISPEARRPRPHRRFKWKVVGNLPYFLTTPILFHLIEHRKWIDWAVIMIQKEVAARILAVPGNKSYGRLTLAFRYYADVHHEFDVSRHCFSPVPSVDSSVLRIHFRHSKVRGLDEELLFKVIQAAFAARRKNILNGLTHSPLGLSRDQWKILLDQEKIPVNTRAEELLLKDYMALTRVIKKVASSQQSAGPRACPGASAAVLGRGSGPGRVAERLAYRQAAKSLDSR